MRIGGRLCIYGPFVDGAQTFSLGNEEFDARLRKANPSLGLRDMGMLAELAEQVGLTMAEPLRMPANNHLLIFERRS